MHWEGTSDSNNKQDANIVTTNTLCDCDSVVELVRNVVAHGDAREGK